MADVILLSGSPRKNSNTVEVLEVCADEIEKGGLSTEILSLRGMQIQSCIACNKCIEKGGIVF